MTPGGMVPVFAMERADAISAPTEPTPGTDGNRPTAPTELLPGTDGTAPTGTDGTDAAVPAPTGLGTDMVPVLAESGRAGAQVRLARRARAWIADVADYQRRHRTFWHAVALFVTRSPETWEKTEQHLNSRKWLQEWMTGRFRWFCEWENVAWGHLVARPGKTALRLAEKVFFERQLGFWLALGFIGLCVLIRMLGG